LHRFHDAVAATATGYAGPVRADVIKNNTKGLEAGDVKVKVAEGQMPAYFARPASVKILRSSWSLWRFSDCTSTSRT
jgi:hypothetical protein